MAFKKFEIRKMKENELSIALEWAQQEGWNPGIEDAKTFYYADPHGFFIGLLEGEPIATGAAVAYDQHFGFCGLYIVKPEYRNKGYGMKLTEARLQYLGRRTIGIDGVMENTEKYARIGYRPAHKNVRYAFTKPSVFGSKEEVVALKELDFETIIAFDRQYFPSARDNFLKAWIYQSFGSALGIVENGELKGYGVIRKCGEGYKIGPLFAETLSIAKDLFEALCNQAGEGSIFLDIPEPNLNALKLVVEYEMEPVFEVMRMYRNGTPRMDLSGIYGITTFELG